MDYLAEVVAKLRDRGIRAEVDAAPDRMQKKIRNAQKQKIPYMLIVGDREVESRKVNVRLRDGSQPGASSVAEMIALIREGMPQVFGS